MDIKEVEEKLRNEMRQWFNTLKSEIEDLINPKLDELIEKLKEEQSEEKRLIDLLSAIDRRIDQLERRVEYLEKKRRFLRR